MFSNIFSIRLFKFPVVLNRKNYSVFTKHSISKKSKLTWKNYALFIFPVASFGLCFWQIRRREWKLKLIESLENLLPLPPVLLSKNITFGEDIPEYTPVKMRGKFIHSREALIGLRRCITDQISEGGYGSIHGNKSDVKLDVLTKKIHPEHKKETGYFVITAFELADRPGEHILVNRGFVPESHRDPITRQKGQINGTIELTGLIRHEERWTMNPISAHDLHVANEPHQWPHRVYHHRAISDMAKQLRTLPIFIDANYESTVFDGPIGGQTVIDIHNRHLEYICTWAGLGIVATFMCIKSIM